MLTNLCQLPRCCTDQWTCKGAWEWNDLKSETPVMCGCVQESQAEVSRLQKQKEDLCAQIRDLSLPVDLASESLPALKKQLRLLESQVNEKAEEITKLTAKIQQQQQVIQHTQNEIYCCPCCFFPHRCLCPCPIDPHAVWDRDGKDEADPSKGVGR